MSGSTLVVTIGRNIGAKPMADKHWRIFKNLVQQALEKAGGSVVQTPLNSHQFGVWRGEAVEHAAAFVVLFGDDAPGRAGLPGELRRIGRQFEQESIGYILAEGINNLIWCE